MPPKTFISITLTYIEVENTPNQFTPTIQVSPDPAILGASPDPADTPPKSPFKGVNFLTDDGGRDLFWRIKEKQGQHPKMINIGPNDNSANWTLPSAVKNSHWKYLVEVWDQDPGHPNSAGYPGTATLLAEKDPEIHWGRRGR